MKAGHFAEGFVQRELARLAAALHTTPEGAAYDELYAAQQALTADLQRMLEGTDAAH